MKDSVKNVLHKLYYSISANLINFIVSLFISFILPKFLGVEEYGYWQLYIFYVGYVGFFHFGHVDGIYLRYGGKYYNDLDKALMHSQYWLLMFIEFFIFIGFYIYSMTASDSMSRAIVLFSTGLNCILVLPRTLLQIILQGTGKVREYAKNFIFERIIFITLVIVFLIYGIRRFEFLIFADIGAKFIALIELGWICRDIILTKGVKIKLAFREFWTNISTGINLLVANIASFLIIGIVRFGIEKVWDIKTFGKVSFSLSISNFMVAFIYAVGIVIFPIIKRTDQRKLPLMFETMGSLLSGMMIIFMILYYPIQELLFLWLPNYHDAIRYFAILFPISIFEARSTLLINTYLKALREEKAMLVFNCISVLISIITTIISVLIFKNLTLAIFSIVFLVFIKCYLPDLYLQKKMGMSYSWDILWVVSATLSFIFCNWIIGGIAGWIYYIIIVLLVSLFRRKEYRIDYIKIRSLLG